MGMNLHDPNAMDNSEMEGLVMLLITFYIMVMWLAEVMQPFVHPTLKVLIKP